MGTIRVVNDAQLGDRRHRCWLCLPADPSEPAAHGGEATLEQIVERAGTGETDIYYIASCLIVPEPTRTDPDVLMPFALPAAWKPSVWRTEAHWTAEDLEDGVRYLGGGDDRDGQT